MNLEMVEKHQGERNYGIDLLRVFSMILIVILHILGHGGILEASELLSIKYECAWLLETAAYCAVNCYALISGYVAYGAKYKISNILYLYFQVIFYTLIITAIVVLFRPDIVNIKVLLAALFPFALETYWYFTAYFVMFFFIPVMNFIIEKYPKTNLQKVMIMIIIIFSILPTIFHYDMCKTNAGYSVLWLTLMYLIGAYIKKYDIPEKLKNWGGVFLCVFVSWFVKLLIELFTNKILGEAKGGNYLISYTSPTVILCAVKLLYFFKNCKLGDAWRKIINFFAPASFGVYLIHSHPLINDIFIEGKFEKYLTFEPYYMVLAVLGTALLVWFVCSLIDKVRIFLFGLFNIKEKCIILCRRCS